jgi:hypothetical protein|nr:MAG TPA: Protein of unknown function (DUF3848) [Caudoviricetes sp.]
MSEKKHTDGVDTPATAAESTLATTEVTVEHTTDKADPLAALQSKLSLLQAKLHKEFRWYCDTILQGGSLAVRVSYRVQPAADILQTVDGGEVRDDPALGDYCILIGGSLYCEEDMDRLLAVEYLLDDLYDTWCSIEHSDEEWSDVMDRYLDTVER